MEIIGPDIPFKGAGAGVSYHLDFAAVMCKEAGVMQRVVPWTKIDYKRQYEELKKEYDELKFRMDGLQK